MGNAQIYKICKFHKFFKSKPRRIFYLNRGPLNIEPILEFIGVHFFTYHLILNCQCHKARDHIILHKVLKGKEFFRIKLCLTFLFHISCGALFRPNLEKEETVIIDLYRVHMILKYVVS